MLVLHLPGLGPRGKEVASLMDLVILVVKRLRQHVRGAVSVVVHVVWCRRLAVLVYPVLLQLSRDV